MSKEKIMQVKTYGTTVGAVKKYSFPFTILDDDGEEHHKRTANDGDVEDALGGQGETSPSEYLHALTLAEQEKFPQMSYTAALQRVRDRNPKLMRIYANEVGGCVRVY